MSRVLTEALLLVGLVAALTQADTTQFNLISDLHYDAYYGTPQAYPGNPTCGAPMAPKYGARGCDAPFALLESALRDAAAQGSSYTVMSGDWLRHDANAVPFEGLARSFEDLASNASKLLGHGSGHLVLPAPDFSGALGNDDFVPDYYFNLSAPVHPVLAQWTQSLVGVGLLRTLPGEDEQATFARCGYYVRVVAPTLRLVVLNSVVWCRFHIPAPRSGSLPADPCGQFAFLAAQLQAAAANGSKVWIVSHIPFGADLYKALNTDDKAPLYWHDDYMVKYQSLLTGAAGTATVVHQFFGHTHHFSVLAAASFLPVPGFIVPSISPVFGNNPSYLKAVVDTATWQVVTLTQRFLSSPLGGPMAQWADTPYTINSVLGVPDSVVGGVYPLASSERLGRTMLAHVQQTPTGWYKFELLFSGGSTPMNMPVEPCGEWCLGSLACSVLFAQTEPFAACRRAAKGLSSRPPDATTIAYWIAGFLGVVVAWCGMVWAVDSSVGGRGEV